MNLSLQPIKSLMTALLPYLTVMFSVCQLILSTLNSKMKCTITPEFVTFLNETSPSIYNQVNNTDFGSVSIAMSAVIAGLTLIFSLYGQQVKKQVKSLTNDKNNLSEKLETMTTTQSMWRPSLGREPFDYEQPQSSPIDSIKTAYPPPVTISMTEENEYIGEEV